MKKTITIILVVGTLAAATAFSMDADAAACHWMWTPWAGWICA